MLSHGGRSLLLNIWYSIPANTTAVLRVDILPNIETIRTHDHDQKKRQRTQPLRNHPDLCTI